MNPLTNIFKAFITFLFFSGIVFTQNMSSIKFDTEDVAYIVGDNGYISKTTDRGTSWFTLTTNLSDNINDIVITGDYEFFVACDNGKLLKTTDGGSSWTQLTSEITENLNSLVFTHDSRMIACGDNSMILISTDYGDTWENIYTPASSDLRKIFFFDDSQGYMVGTNGTILTTNDGGLSWNVKMTNYFGYNFNSISMIDDKTGTIAGDNGLIFKTSHNWNKWRIINSPTNGSINDVTFIDSITGIAIGTSSILKTTDKGETWSNLTLPVKRGTEVYNSICFPAEDLGFITSSTGSILYSTDRGNTWIPISKNTNVTDNSNPEVISERITENLAAPKNFNLSQNYPNPFNPSTMINYYLPQDSHLNLKVYDMTGKEVATLVNEFKTAGSYSVQFNASGLSSGIYFYSMVAENGSNKIVKTMKMILTK